VAAPGKVWALGLAAAATLFDGGARSANLAHARAGFEATAASYRQTVLNGFQEVEDNLAAVGSLQQEYAAQQRASGSARAAEHVALSQYRAGTVTYINVITAQALALSNERAALQVQGRAYAASVALIKAVGGGWCTGQLPPAAKSPCRRSGGRRHVWQGLGGRQQLRLRRPRRFQGRRLIMNNESGPGGVKGSAGNSSSAAPARRMLSRSGAWGRSPLPSCWCWPGRIGVGSRTPPRLPHRRQLRPRCRCALLWSPKDMPVVVTGIGSVVPAASVVIRTRVDGQLDQVAFKEGQDVKAGQVLARLDARTYQAQLQQVQAQKAKDEALLANAQADLQRYNELIRDEATTRQTLETQNHWYASCKPRCKTMQPR
jgi:hypothetical protein